MRYFFWRVYYQTLGSVICFETSVLSAAYLRVSSMVEYVDAVLEINQSDWWQKKQRFITFYKTNINYCAKTI